MEIIDWEDSGQLNRFSFETMEIATEYLSSRTSHGVAKRKLHQGLAEMYRDHKIDRKYSFEKALLLLINENPALGVAYQEMIEQSDVSEGLKEVLKTRQAHLSLAQSLIKNRIHQT